MTERSEPPNDETQTLTEDGQPDKDLIVHRATRVSKTYSGPIPPPDMLQEYDLALPGTADRIISMAERQQHHRFAMDKATLRAETRRSMTGLVCGFFVAIAAYATAVAAFLTGNALIGGITATGYTAAIVSVFVLGSREQRAEREFRAQPLDDLEEEQ